MLGGCAYRQNESQAHRHSGPYDYGHVSLAERRLQALLRQIEAEHGYGWQSHVARIVGIHQTHVGRLLAGERGASPETVEAFQRGLRIRPEYFSDTKLGDAPDYHRFQLPEVEPKKSCKTSCAIRPRRSCCI